MKTIELTEEQVCILYHLLDRIGGPPEGPRGSICKLKEQLTDNFRTFPREVCRFQFMEFLAKEVKTIESRRDVSLYLLPLEEKK